MQTPPEFLTFLRQVGPRADQARKHVDTARQELARAEQASTFWQDLVTHLRAGNPANVLLVLRREVAVEIGSPVAAELEKIRAEAEALARQIVPTFGRDFPEAVRNAGLEIDSTSRHPRYTFRQGFIRVEVDERNFIAKLIPRDGTETLVGMDLGALIKSLQQEISRIFGRKLDAEGLLRSLYTAYAATLRAENRPEGEEVPLRRVMNRMAKNLSRFRGDEFNVDLAQLVRSGNTTVDGRRMHLNHTRKARLGVLLHGLESGGYVGFISFK